MKKRIAIQGFEGCFHQEAALQFYGPQIEIIPCATFGELIRIAQNDPECDGALMAIENSIAGSILPNYNLLEKSLLNIAGEIYLKIDQHLLANKNVAISDIHEVYSHPMALLQCRNFLESHPFKTVETEDTALSAKWIKETKSAHGAAIAGKLAAEIFDLQILKENIHTQPYNYTRFWALQKQVSESLHSNKASMVFETDHSKGSLARVLSLIAACDVNLSKLQSMPIAGSHWRYAFHVDCEFNHQQQLQEVLSKIKSATARVKLYGVYKNGKF